MTDVLANTKIYKNYQTVIPKEIRKEFNVTDKTVIAVNQIDLFVKFLLQKIVIDAVRNFKMDPAPPVNDLCRKSVN